MDRKEKINKLLSEGFSSNTLMNFNDKQIESLYKRIVSEDATQVSSKTPNIQNVIKNLKSQGIEDIEITEDEIENNLGIKEKSDILAKGNLKEWVNGLVKKNYSNFTSKNEILEMINSKMNEEENINKIPEFMTYDAIVADAPTIAPAKPKTTPKTTPGIKPRTPYNPGPGKNPKPKAMGKTHSIKEDKKVNPKK